MRRQQLRSGLGRLASHFKKAAEAQTTMRSRSRRAACTGQHGNVIQQYANELDGKYIEPSVLLRSGAFRVAGARLAILLAVLTDIRY